jgi:hypothetical protein
MRATRSSVAVSAAAPVRGGEVRRPDAADPAGAEPLGQAGEHVERDRARRDIQAGHLDQLGHELEAQVGALHPRELALEHVDASAHVAADALHVGQRDDRAHAGVRIAGRVRRLAQVYAFAAEIATARIGVRGERRAPR